MTVRDVLVAAGLAGVLAMLGWMAHSISELRKPPTAPVCKVSDAESELIRVRGDLLSCRAELDAIDGRHERRDE